MKYDTWPQYGAEQRQQKTRIIQIPKVFHFIIIVERLRAFLREGKNMYITQTYNAVCHLPLMDTDQA